jgi:Domain of unknown function (DUF4266)
MRNKSAIVRLLILTFALGLLASCATTPVQPWERGRLARWDMRWDADAKESAMTNHTYFSKEGTTGEIGAAGGGCGCN